MTRKGGQRGFTLIELVIVIGVIAILAALIIPMTVSYLANAQVQRAKADVKMIGAAILEFNQDMREWPIWASGTATKPYDTAYNVLYSENGDDISTVTGGTDTAKWGDSANWDSLDDQLITNGPGYPITVVKTTAAGTTGRTRIWRGPYLENISEDPWGNKYYVNVMYLQPSYRAPGTHRAVFVISAGPDETIDTTFEQAITAGAEGAAFTVGGDDIVHRIR